MMAVATVACFCAFGAAHPAKGFAKGERVTLLGDSITHGGAYGANLQLFWDLRFPGSGTRIMNCGESGGTAGGGLARWERDVLAQKADRIFVMFGMNDVGRGDLSNAAMYATNMAEIASRTIAAGKRLAVVTPTPYDEYGTNYTAQIRTNCNTVGLSRLAETYRSLAAERDAELVDLHAPLTRFVRGERDFSFCRADRVHPTPAGHVIMTAEILSQMGVSPYVAKVEIDAASCCVSGVKGAKVSELGVRGGRMSFNYAPETLPFPTSREYLRAAAAYPVTEKMNLEMLAVKGLPSGTYALAADGKELGRFSAEELAAGVNLALLPTPGAALAKKAWDVSRELAAVQSSLRSLVLVESVAGKLGADLSSAEDVLEKMGVYVEGLKKKGASYAGYYGRQLEQYRKNKPREEEMRRQEEDCRVNLREAAAKKWSAMMEVFPVGNGDCLR